MGSDHFCLTVAELESSSSTRQLKEGYSDSITGESLSTGDLCPQQHFNLLLFILHLESFASLLFSWLLYVLNYRLPISWLTSFFGVAILQELSKKHSGGNFVSLKSDYIYFSSFIHCFPCMTNALIRYGILGCKWVSLEPVNVLVNHAQVSSVTVETSDAILSLVLCTWSVSSSSCLKVFCPQCSEFYALPCLPWFVL